METIDKDEVTTYVVECERQTTPIKRKARITLDKAGKTSYSSEVTLV
jgi:hypothetical protein